MIADADGEINVSVEAGHMRAHYVLANAVDRGAHSHTEFQVFIPLAQRGLRVRYEGDSGVLHDVRHDPGSVHLVDALQPHAFAWDTLEMVSFFFSAETLQHVAHEVTGRHVPTSAWYGLQDAVIPRVALGLREHLSGNDHPSRLFIESAALVVAGRLVERLSRRVASPHTRVVAHARIRVACDFIEEHLSEELPLEAIARAAGMSPFHFLRTFQTATGTTPHRHILDRRLERVRARLETTRDTVTNLAYEFGFANPSHLAAGFRKRFGASPSEYRRAIGVDVSPSVARAICESRPKGRDR